MAKKKIVESECLNKSFIRNCEIAFEPDFETEQEDQYQGIVANPFYEREAVEQFERSLEFAD
jgi:hypothetical protein